VNGNPAAKNTTATFTKAGTYAFQVVIRDAGNQSVTSGVSVMVSQTLTAVGVTPASASVVVNGSQPFAANGRDQFGEAMGAMYEWAASGGTINASGLFTRVRRRGDRI